MRRSLTALALSLLPALASPAPAAAAWVWPLRGEVITPYRNGTDPYAGGQHRGIDIAGAGGSAVVAAAPGEVRFAGTAGSSGLTVSVRTDDGFDTSYLHLGAVDVKAGERVSAAQRLGVVGTTGVRSAAAPHLHFGVREAGSRHAYRDPLALLPPLATPLPETPAPAPLPAPVPPAPVAAPLPRGVPSPVRLPARRPAARPAPRAIPRARRAPSPRPAPQARRRPAPRPAPSGQPVADARRVPVARPAPTPLPAARPARAPEPRASEPGRPAAGRRGADAPHARRSGTPALGPAPVQAPVLSESAAGPPPERPDRKPGTSGAGPDLGWALACAGVLLAAAVLTLGGERGGPRRPGARQAAARFSAAIRPLLGRR